jgi:hypothetical protein
VEIGRRIFVDVRALVKFLQRADLTHLPTRWGSSAWADVY